MIITKLRIQEEHPMTGTISGSWPLPLCDLNVDASAGENGYVLISATGLGPPDLIAIVEGFDSTGIPIMGHAAQKRDIVLKIGLDPGLGQSYGQLRDALYRMISRSVLFSLMDESLILAQTTGYIRQVEPVHFSNAPEIQITIECNDGDFSAPFPVDIPLATLNTLHPVINYEDGTAPTGLQLQFTVTANTASFTISHHSEFWHADPGDVNNIFLLTYAFLTGDVITISTQPKEKTITRLRAGVTLDLAGYINAGAVWPKLYSGVNAFDWTFASSWMTWTSANYIPKYWGV